MTREDSYADLRTVSEANEKAFEAMGNIRPLLLSGKKRTLVDTVNEAFKNVGVLASEFIQCEPSQVELVKEAFSLAYANTLEVIEKAIILSTLKGGSRSTEAHQLLDSNASKGLYKLVESLPDQFEGSKPDYKIQHVNTLHGLIRFFHQRLIELSFDPKTLIDNENLVSYSLGKGRFALLDIANQINPAAKERKKKIARSDIYCKPMQAILDFYAQSHESMESEQYHCLLMRDAINLHVKLNQHSAEINAKLDGERSHIRFSYREFLNAAWRDRIDYISEGMRLLGFKILSTQKNLDTDGSTKKSEAIVAEKKEADEQSVYGSLTELARLLASSTHLNCEFEHLNGLITYQDALKIFFNGSTNVYNEMNKVQGQVSEYPPKPPRQEWRFTQKFQGATYEEKLANAERAYQKEIRKYWDKVKAGEITLGKAYAQIQDLPDLEILVAKRKKELGITK